MLRLAYDPMDPSKMAVGAAVLQCNGDGVGNDARYNILDFDFFDDDTLVVVFRENGAAGACCTTQPSFHAINSIAIWDNARTHKGCHCRLFRSALPRVAAR